MSSRTLWIAGLIVALGVTLAIKSRWPGSTGRTAADGRSAAVQEVRPDPEPVAEPSGESAPQTRNRNVRDEEPALADSAPPATTLATTPATRSVTSLDSLGVTTPPSRNVRDEEPAQTDSAPPATTPATRSVTSLDSLGVTTPPIPEFRQTEQAFASEDADPAWSPVAEAHILGDISQATGLQALDIQVDCRTSMCRVQMLQPQFPQGSFQDLVHSMGLEPVWVFNLVGRNGTPVTLAYLKRNTTDGVDRRR